MARRIIKEWTEGTMLCFTEIVKGSYGVEREFSKKVYNCTEYDYRTPNLLMHQMDYTIRSGRRVRIFYGHDNGKDWHEEYAVLGRISKSRGSRYSAGIPILIHNARSMGGGAILDHCIVKLVDCATKRVLYQHPNYDGGVFEIHDVSEDLKAMGYMQGVSIDGTNHANFKKPGQAERWVAYMKGERMAK